MPTIMYAHDSRPYASFQMATNCSKLYVKEICEAWLGGKLGMLLGKKKRGADPNERIVKRARGESRATVKCA